MAELPMPKYSSIAATGDGGFAVAFQQPISQGVNLSVAFVDHAGRITATAVVATGPGFVATVAPHPFGAAVFWRDGTRVAGGSARPRRSPDRRSWPRTRCACPTRSSRSARRLNSRPAWPAAAPPASSSPATPFSAHGASCRRARYRSPATSRRTGESCASRWPARSTRAQACSSSLAPAAAGGP